MALIAEAQIDFFNVSQSQRGGCVTSSGPDFRIVQIRCCLVKDGQYMA